jgi:hypothetical protein
LEGFLFVFKADCDQVCHFFLPGSLLCRLSTIRKYRGLTNSYVVPRRLSIAGRDSATLP